MKPILLIVFFLLTVKIAVSQEVSKNPKSDLGFYATMLDNYSRTTASHFPDRILINGSMLTYVDEFLGEKTFATGLKKYILENGWEFLKDIDTTGIFKKHAQIKMRELLPVLSKETKRAMKHSDLFFNFSPIVFSKDKKKAFLVFSKGNGSEVVEVITYFFEMINGKWKLVNTMVPYYI